MAMLKIKVRKYNFRDPVFPRPLQLTGLEIRCGYMDTRIDALPYEWKELAWEYDAWCVMPLKADGLTVQEAKDALETSRIQKQDELFRNFRAWCGDDD